jgi:hypothetical protein
MTNWPASASAPANISARPDHGSQAGPSSRTRSCRSTPAGNMVTTPDRKIRCAAVHASGVDISSTPTTSNAGARARIGSLAGMAASFQEKVGRTPRSRPDGRRRIAGATDCGLTRFGEAVPHRPALPWSA